MTLLEPTNPGARRDEDRRGPLRGNAASGAADGRRASQDGRRWSDLATAVGLDPRTPVLLALSGGADSLYLLHVLAAARPEADVRAVHVEHGLRGDASRADAEACRQACRALDVPLAVEELRLAPAGRSLEARARAARYAALARQAASDGRVVLTAHHADDSLETVLWRLTRGSGAPGLRGPATRAPLPHAGSLRAPDGAPLQVARPLARLRRHELQAWLRTRGVAWREDESNLDRRHTRNRIRHDLLPWIERVGGADAVGGLHAFADAVDALEGELAARTADLAWAPLDGAEPDPARRAGGTLARAALVALPVALRRRALWRLVREGTGRAPTRALVEQLVDDLGHGRCARHALPGGASLHLRSDQLVLDFEPAASRPQPATERGVPPAGSPAAIAPTLLRVDQVQALPDGRVLRLRLEPHDGSVAVGPDALALHGDDLPAALRLRHPRPGERFHALGAPGSKRLVRFLADRGVPRGARARAWVLADPRTDEALGVLGQGPAEHRRLGPATTTRLVVEALRPSQLPGWAPSLAPPVDAARAPGRRGRDTGPRA